ncbi:DNA polymerase III subunit epsilon [Helicobacter valdiviensis]|uniref:DNA polymerase III subunit epsilon n=1 Tax=Helicobacter valdiviensis TaxID=1458358 RepID=A0A2W6NEH1_9HELI|nr:3'-5' exonuclease [Helicobacter valdiviensis]PZT47360.1 DNA polymerase III subunit epsilon [Helicobacter valdiviensis]
MPKRYDSLISSLVVRPNSLNEFESKLCRIGGLFADKESELELIKNSGISLYFAHDKVYFRPKLTEISEESYCIVDIETNGHNPKIHQPIEIGAILYQKGKVQKTFSSFVSCEYIPPNIVELTGIQKEMLRNAPPLHQVLEAFKLFLGDSIFVAHNVLFDYSFLSHSMHKHGFGYLYNPALCTIKLAQNTFSAQKYSLAFLNEFLGIYHSPLHRALEDCKVALEIFQYCLKRLPKNIHTSYDLLQLASLQFSQNKNNKNKSKE